MPRQSSKLRLKSALEKIKVSGKLHPDFLLPLKQEEKELVQTLYDEGLTEASLGFIETLQVDEDWKTLKNKMLRTELRSIPLWKSVLKYAAMLVGLFILVHVFQMKYMNKELEVIAENSIKLKLGDNNVKVIDQKVKQQLVLSSDVVVGEQVGNRIRYRPDSNIKKLLFNELEVPNGKIFELELSDGTVVYINSGTKIKYPIKFLNGHNREVFISGEAYFKVAPDKAHPFIVHANAVALEVLGTEFNVSSYREDIEIKSVLVEGSVKMTNIFEPQDSLVLMPGNKGSWNKAFHGTTMEVVETEVYTGWMKGELIFRSTTFENMIKKLERKYNVEIQNNNAALNDKILTATFNSEIESIEDILKSIGEIFPLRYEVTDKRIILF